MNKNESMPLVGMGTWQVTNKNILKETIVAGVNNGYKLIDTAEFYNNHKQIGEILKELNINRDDLWITTKVPNMPGNHKEAKFISKAKSYLNDMQIDYLDLLLIHATFRKKEKNVSAFKALLKLQEEGITNHIGISNWSMEEIEEVYQEVGVYPYCAQIVVSPKTRIEELEAFCKKNNILLTGYSIIKPYFAQKANPFYGDDYILNDEEKSTIDNMCTKYGKDVGQLLNKWAIQHNYHIIPKSNSAKRVISNMNIFDFEIDSQDMKTLDSMNEMNNELYRKTFHQSFFKTLSAVLKARKQEKQ